MADRFDCHCQHALFSVHAELASVRYCLFAVWKAMSPAVVKGFVDWTICRPDLVSGKHGM